MKFNTEIITLKISSSFLPPQMFSPYVGCLIHTSDIKMK